MKYIISFFFLMIFSISYSQEFYYYNDSKIHLTQLKKKAYLQLSRYDDNIKGIIESKGWKVTNWLKTEGHRSFELLNEKYKDELIYGVYVETDKEDNPIPSIESAIYSSYFYLNENNNKAECVPSSMIYVELKSANDYELLNKIALEHNVEILGRVYHRSEFHILRCKSGSKQHPIEVSRRFKETNLFASAEPDLIGLNLTSCANDPNLGDQWGLNNTGQFGGTPNVDIKACSAWFITKGDPNVTIAVIDQGIDLSHVDLFSNLSPLSLNTMTNSSPSALHGGHGVLCAGIAAARGDNGIFGSGVAPYCKLMSISNDLAISNGSMAIQIALGFDFARMNSASIISNSYFVPAQNTILDKAISDALTLGRNGSGCVVVFATGNDGSSVRYPANSHPDIITVGAIDNNGIIPSFSNYGTELDIMAPGVNIRSTTFNSNFSTTGADGTSYACPHVSGVAALMLSVNPCLSQKGVHDIICKTGQKTQLNSIYGGIPWMAFNTNVRDNRLGSWSSFLGHGIVDAYESVLMATNANFYLQNKTVSDVRNYSYQKILVGKNVDINSQSGDYKVSAGGNLSLKAKESVELKDGSHVLNGSTFHAIIDPSHCNFSNPVLKVSKTEVKPSSSPSASMNSKKIISMISAYPNPTNDLVYIEYTLSENSNVLIEVLDIQGKKMQTDNFLRYEGTYKDQLDIFKNLNSGQYFVNITVGKYKESFKILKDYAK